METHAFKPLTETPGLAATPQASECMDAMCAHPGWDFTWHPGDDTQHAYRAIQCTAVTRGTHTAYGKPASGTPVITASSIGALLAKITAGQD